MGDKIKRKILERGRKTVKNRILVLLCVLLLCGCAQPSPEPAQPAETSLAEAVLPAAQPEISPEVSGVFLDTESMVPPGVEGLVIDYMNLYYQSLANLQLCPIDDLQRLFTAEGDVQALGNHTVWNYLIQTRAMQPTDLSMAACSYTMTCRYAEETDQGDLRLLLVEQSRQNFAAHSDIDSEAYNVYHSFTARQLADGSWRLSSHMQMDSLYFSLFGDSDESELNKAFQTPAFQQEDAQIFLQNRLENLLQAAQTHYDLRGYGQPEEVTADHTYDRKAAVEYAHLYALDRNPQWDDYGRYGGNCQNFVSQCLLAGGIPMDISGNALWKWYGTTPNEQRSSYGRSASWSSVESFRDYVVNNRGGAGLVAVIDAPYFSGAEGDVLQMGAGDDRWKHTVIITGLVKDEYGKTVDYLVNSNTADLRNYPAGAYTYTDLSLVHIVGWNE